MSNSLILLKSEFIRLYKYKIIPISLGISILWMLILYVMGPSSAKQFVGLFIALDASIMSILMLGASLFFEREENTLKPLLVTPVSIESIILVKVISGIYVALQSAVLVSIFVGGVMGLTVHYGALIGLVSLIAITHAMIGFVMSMRAPDFNGLLVSIILYSFIFALPPLLITLEIIPLWLENILWISPIHDALIYMNMVFDVDQALTVTDWPFLISLVYLIGLSGGLYIKIIRPNYANAAVKE